MVWWSEAETRSEAGMGIHVRADNSQDRRDAMAIEEKVELMAD